MTNHEQERRAFWDMCCAAPYVPGDTTDYASSNESEAANCAALADAKLAERDKRFGKLKDGEAYDHA